LLRDLTAVVDHLRLERFIVYASGGFCHVALDYAIAHPERVIGLVFHSVAVANAAWGPILWNDLLKENWSYFLESLIPAGLSVEEHQRRFRMNYETATYEDYRAITDLQMASNVAPLLERVRTPVLVLHPRDTVRLPVSEPMKVAAAIQGASLVLLSGEGLWPEPAEGVTAIERFLDDLATSPKATPDTPARISPRETEVLRLIAAGRSNQQIADELVLSLRTVERHITNLYSKIGARGKADATAYALRHGLDDAGASTSALSRRELEVLRLLTAGVGNQQIADDLVISLNTVRRHVSNIFDKTGVANRAQAAIYAREHGIA
jgi:DNA-binding NarL/FixJ family response regulator